MSQELREIVLTDATPANVSAYTSTSNSAKSKRRRDAREAAREDRADLAERLATLGIRLAFKDIGAVPAHTYVLWRGTERWGWWWPSSGRTRFSGAAGPYCPTADHLIACVNGLIGPSNVVPLSAAKRLAPSTAVLANFAFAEWLTKRLPANWKPRIWYPHNIHAFVRIYIVPSGYIHFESDSYRYASSGVKTHVEGALERLGVKKVEDGWQVPRESPTV